LLLSGRSSHSSSFLTCSACGSSFVPASLAVPGSRKRWGNQRERKGEEKIFSWIHHADPVAVFYWWC
jgi:hypothetical protein